MVGRYMTCMRRFPHGLILYSIDYWVFKINAAEHWVHKVGILNKRPSRYKIVGLR